MSYFRNIRTTQERRANQEGQWILTDFGTNIKIRGRRTKLPYSWWYSTPRHDWTNHNWKRHRLTQHHAIMNMT